MDRTETERLTFKVQFIAIVITLYIDLIHQCMNSDEYIITFFIPIHFTFCQNSVWQTDNEHNNGNDNYHGKKNCVVSLMMDTVRGSLLEHKKYV